MTTFPKSSALIADAIEEAIFDAFGVEPPPGNSRPIRTASAEPGQKPHPNPELHRLLRLWPMSSGAASELLRRDERTVRRWINGQYPLDAETRDWLGRLCGWIEGNPPPYPSRPSVAASALP